MFFYFILVVLGTYLTYPGIEPRILDQEQRFNHTVSIKRLPNVLAVPQNVSPSV